MFARILIGLLMVLVGFFMVKKPDKFFEFIGPIQFAEKMFMGGSKSFYKILGIIIILIGFLVVTNLYAGFFEGLFNFFF